MTVYLYFEQKKAHLNQKGNHFESFSFLFLVLNTFVFLSFIIFFLPSLVSSENLHRDADELATYCLLHFFSYLNSVEKYSIFLILL